MIEAVGWKDFDTFFARCSELLEPDGAMLLQAITMDDRAYRIERVSRSFIRTMIFPNGCLPSQEIIARCIARDTDMRAVHMEDLTPHYAETLHRWRENLDAHADELERARLRRALPAAVADVPLLLRGGLRRAPDRARAGAVRQAALAPGVAGPAAPALRGTG